MHINEISEQMTWKDKSQPPVINAVCPIGSNQIGYLVDNDVVMVSEAIDGKGTFYQPSATFSRKINGDTPDISDVSIRRFSLVASTSHTNKIIAVVINGQIWTSQVYDQTSAQVRYKPLVTTLKAPVNSIQLCIINQCYFKAQFNPNSKLRITPKFL